MDWTSLELKLISCKDLKAFNFFQKLSAYSVVSITIINEQAKKKEDQRKHLQRQKTSIDKGGKNPEWNHVFEFDLQEKIPRDENQDHVFLMFDLRSEGLVGRTIGEVRVPLKDLIDEFCGVVRFVSYQVRNSDGKPNGVLNFSYKLIGRKNQNQKSEKNISPDPSFKNQRVVYPKLDLDDDDDKSQKIHYPSLDDIQNSPSDYQIPEGYAYYSRNSVILLPMQVPVSQGWMPGTGRYLHQNPRSSSPMAMAQPSAGTYLYTVEPTCYGNGLQSWL